MKPELNVEQKNEKQYRLKRPDIIACNVTTEREPNDAVQNKSTGTETKSNDIKRNGTMSQHDDGMKGQAAGQRSTESERSVFNA